MIAFQHVTKKYTAERSALRDINLVIDKGTIVSVIGPSGAGKTTLIRCINKLIECTSGDVKIDGQSIMSARHAALKRIRQKTGMIFQNYNLVERLTVIENVLHGCLSSLNLCRSICGLYSKEQKELAFSILTDIGLEEYAYQYCANLSGGQKQRVGIARALMQQPTILLCDEPISSLDPQSSTSILDYITRTVKKQNITCVMNLHHVEYAKQYSDRIIGLKAGQLTFDGLPAELSDEALQHIFCCSTSPPSRTAAGNSF